MGVEQQTASERIISFVYCDKVEYVMTPNGPFWQISQPLDALKPVSLPSNYSFAISFIISMIKPGSMNHISVIFEGPDHNEVKRFDMPETVAPTNTATNDETLSLQSNVDFRNVVLAKAGTYTTRIFLNNAEVGAYEIEVRSVGKIQNGEE